VCAALTVAASVSCSSGSEKPELSAVPLESPSEVTGAGEPGLQRYYEQEVAWSACREVMECAEVEVPLDYADPDGEPITLSLLRVPASEEDQRIGSLLVNPGGPGGSGVDYAANAEVYFGAELRAAFDIVGFDPRGVVRSTPIDCVTDAELDAFIASDPDPDTPREARQSDALLRQFGQGCLERSGDLTRHVSTEEAARDMDVIRAVLGEPKLTYFGASYGTFLGATYADLFPERVGRMVFDGAIDPSLSSVETSLVQAEGFEVALEAYVANCVESGDCYLGSTTEDGMAAVRTLLEQLDAEPISGDGERELTEGLAVLGIWAPLYNRDNWSVLDSGLSQALDGDGRTLLLLADQYVSRGPDGYLDNAPEALYAVNCLDSGEAVSLEEARAQEEAFLEVSSVFGRIFAFGLSACGSWPVQSGKQPQALDAAGADPILVVGTSRDPATPLAWAEALAEQLESGVLVTRDGDGHTGYSAGNDCVDDVVEKYLVAGEVPDGDVDC
jgi:pimeloyl-ACP methyl ester carboxylesterase